MQKKYADFKLGVPDYVTVETEAERLVCQGGQTTVAAGATTVEFQDAGEHEDIFVTSEDAVRCVKLDGTIDPEISQISGRCLGTYLW